MNHTHTEETMEDSHDQENPTENISCQKGGLRTIPFIIVNLFCERVASYGLGPNMILYLTKEYQMDVVTGTVITSMWSALSDFLSIVGASIADSYLGRFRVIVIGSIISLLGMSLLWLTAMIQEAKPSPCTSSHVCGSATTAQLALLLFSLGLISIGSGCIRPCSLAFGADQLVQNENVKKDERILDSYFNWYYASTAVAAILALTVMVYIQDQLGWQVGFGASPILIFLSGTFFLVGSSMYVKVTAHKSLLAGLTQVLVVAFKNRHLLLQPDTSDNGHYYHSKDSELAAPSDRLRFLNKACIIRDQEELHLEGSASKSWELCTVDQVEQLKSFIGVIPIWSTGIMIFVTFTQSSITVLQANSMNRHITSNFEFPAGSFGLFMVVTLTIWLAMYDRIVLPAMMKYTGLQHKITPMQRMGIGLLISCMAMAVGAVVENIRRRIAVEEGLSEYPTAVVGMSAMWLAPQFCLSGLAEAFNAVAQLEFYFSHLPEGMSSMAMAIFTLGTALAGLLGSLIVNIVNRLTMTEDNISWLSSNLNKGHYDYYYALLTFLSLLNYVYFLFCCRAYKHSEEERSTASGESEDLKEALLTRSREFPSTSSA